MLLWIGFAILAAAVAGALAAPFRAASAARLTAREADSAVYRDQLAEIEADCERGLLGEQDAESARAEVARRLLQSADRQDAGLPSSETTSRVSQGVLTGVVAAVPVLSAALYLVFGSPSLPGQPLAARGAASLKSAPIGELITKVEQQLRRRPEDGRGWDVIAPVYLRMGRNADAAHAYRQAIRLQGESVHRLMGFAQATLAAADGIVSDEVERAAKRILELQPGLAEPRAWLALRKEQDGDVQGAITGYRALLEDAPQDAPWRKAVEERLAGLEGRPPSANLGSNSGAAQPEASGPTPESAAAVKALPPDQQAQFIEGMVGRLAARLKSNGKDLDGWQKLIRAYQVMGRTDDARVALTEARSNFKDDNDALEVLDNLAKSLDLG